MIEPKELPVLCQSGLTKTFIISKFPATVGREIITQYPITGAPKVGDYRLNEELMLRMMTFVEVVLPDGKTLALTTRALVDNHCPDWEVLVKIEAAMMEYNCSFFANGGLSNFLGASAATAQTWITQTLTDLLGQLSARNKQHSDS